MFWQICVTDIHILKPNSAESLKFCLGSYFPRAVLKVPVFLICWNVVQCFKKMLCCVQESALNVAINCTFSVRSDAVHSASFRGRSQSKDGRCRTREARTSSSVSGTVDCYTSSSALLSIISLDLIDLK